VFLLTNEATVQKYKSELIDEIEPAINELIERAEQGLKTLYQKESVLQTKVSLLFGELLTLAD
jgi:DASH complex subunit SPC19